MPIIKIIVQKSGLAPRDPANIPITTIYSSAKAIRGRTGMATTVSAGEMAVRKPSGVETPRAIRNLGVGQFVFALNELAGLRAEPQAAGAHAAPARRAGGGHSLRGAWRSGDGEWAGVAAGVGGWDGCLNCDSCGFLTGYDGVAWES